MKLVFFVIAVVAFFLKNDVAAAQTVEKTAVVFDSKLVHLLDSLHDEDQRWRNLLTKIRNGQADSSQLGEARKMMRETDSLSHFHLKKIIEERGFPNYDLVGEDGSHNFWLLMQHQDKYVFFQENVLDLMKIEVEKGKASGKDYAYLLDRVAVNSDKPQTFGTQMHLNADSSSYEPKPCLEPEKLNERRASVGLGTIENYIETMNQRYFGTLKKG